MAKHAKFLVIALATVLSMSCFLVSPANAGKKIGDELYLNFGGSQPGGSWYVMAGGLAPLLTREIKGLNVVAEATMGDVEDTTRISQRDLDLTLTHSVTMAQAYRGIGMFKGKEPGKYVRVLAKLYDSPSTLITLPGSPIDNIMDLEGKNIAGGPQGSGSVKNLKLMLETFGIKNTSMKYFTYADEADALIQGNIDAFLQNSAPIGNVLSVEARKGIKIVPFTKEQCAEFTKEHPGFWCGDLPVETYRTMKKPVLTIWDTVFWVADASVPEDIAYRMLQVVFSPEGRKKVAKIHKSLTHIGDGIQEDKDSMAVPYHPGAVKYWTEQGKKIPPELVPPK